MKTHILIAPIVSTAFLLSIAVASASTLTAACTGTPSASSINWAAQSSGGVAPITFVWGNGSTSTTQTLSYAPGYYSMMLQAIDASSTVASTTCSATVGSAPALYSFGANPQVITKGQSTTLSWNSQNASTTNITHIGLVTGSSIVVSPATTTTYQLSVTNPSGTTYSAFVTVTVKNTDSNKKPLDPAVSAQVKLFLDQIAALRAQIKLLVHPATTTHSVIKHDKKDNDDDKDHKASSTVSVKEHGKNGINLGLHLGLGLGLGHAGDDNNDQ
ncbi:MAG: outer membrane protein precursor [Candidatus Kaiserbacteria bacterium]|nr:outer membrane protein precursor [Candidatus Kaiserbacteria bacterium]